MNDQQHTHKDKPDTGNDGQAARNKQQVGELRKQWKNLLAEQPKLRIRNAARMLGVSEAELLAVRCGDAAVRLRPEFGAILPDLPKLGRVMALSRNDSVVHERHGNYMNYSNPEDSTGLFVGREIDLRIFLRSWDSAFAVTETSHGMTRRSLQFFAFDGEAIHKVYLTEGSDEAAYENLVERFRSDDQSASQAVKPPVAKRPTLPDDRVDVKGFREDWLRLQDSHHFTGLMGKYKVDRLQALRLAPEGDHAVQVDNAALRKAVTEASKTGLPIMVFAGNKGILQIHTGEVHNLLDRDEWFNVIDPEFNLHVKEPDIDQSWIVTKPGNDGSVTSLECFDTGGNMIVQLFGKRKPGIPELESWRELIFGVREELRVAREVRD